MMTDPVPSTRDGRMAFQLRLVSGDAKADTDGDPTFNNPTRVEMQTEYDAQIADINESNDLEAQLEAIKKRIRERDKHMESVQREKLRFVKAIFPNDSGKWKRYGIDDAVSHGKSPQEPIAIRIVAETDSSVTIAIDGGEGADRFELKRRMEGEPSSAAVIVATNIRAGEREYTDAGLEAGQRYVYIATAHNAFGEAGPSNDLLVTP